jgi:hypothetical protein
MPRRFRRCARSARTVKPVRYSNETVAGQGAPTIPGTSNVRKVKNPTLRLVSAPASTPVAILWILAYVPQGFDTFKINMGVAGSAPVSVYEPNQNVIVSGMLTPSGTADPVTYRSRLARNLDSGDKILLSFYNPNAQGINVSISYTFHYAICYGKTFLFIILNVFQTSSPSCSELLSPSR